VKKNITPAVNQKTTESGDEETLRSLTLSSDFFSSLNMNVRVVDSVVT
jgi:hypothetical protein